MSDIAIQFRVNGEDRQVKSTSTRTLLTVLRDDLLLTGSKDGCSSGDCGACTILIDGKVMNACMVLAPQIESSEILTVESLEQNNRLHPLQSAFSEHWAFQCGFCTPGMLMSCYALLLTNNNPTTDEILTAISGNFCRCTGYQGVVKAVQQAAKALRNNCEQETE
jgi:aerobic carbon-monoxide dehydrogenase small subunit